MLYPITQCYTLSHHVVQCKTIFSWQYVHEIIIQARITNMYNETNWCMVGSYDRFNNHWGVYPQWDLINIENNSGNHMQWVYDQQLPIMGLYVYIYICSLLLQPLLVHSKTDSYATHLETAFLTEKNEALVSHGLDVGVFRDNPVGCCLPFGS